jgi:hypothetical protein
MSLNQPLAKASSLLESVDAIRNWRALALLFASFVVGSLFWALGAWVSFRTGVVLGSMGFLFGAITLFYGTNAVGIMLMDEARGWRSRGPLAAMMESLATGHRLIFALLLFGAAYVTGLFVLALLLFVCKIPGLGPFLFTFVFPLAIVLVGMAVFALQAVIFPLTAPSVWSGASTLETLARVGAIARAKLVNVLVMMIVLSFITGAVAVLVLGIVASGTFVTGGLSAAILGSGVSAGLGSLLGGGAGLAGLMGGADAFGGGSYLTAASIGTGLVYSVALTLPALVFVRGCCSVYLANLEGVDVGAMQNQIQGQIDAAKRKAEELRAQAPQGAAFAPTSAPTDAPFAPPAPAVLHCPKCAAPHLESDVFCGNCGHQLK